MKHFVWILIQTNLKINFEGNGFFVCIVLDEEITIFGYSLISGLPSRLGIQYIKDEPTTHLQINPYFNSTVITEKLCENEIIGKFLKHFLNDWKSRGNHNFYSVLQLVLGMFALMALAYSQEYVIESPYFVTRGFDSRANEASYGYGGYGGYAGYGGLGGYGGGYGAGLGAYY